MRFQLGDYVPLLQIPEVDVIQPTVKVFTAAGALIETVTLPAVPERLRGVHFVGRLKLDGRYSVGKHLLFYQATNRAYADQFEIVGGGNETGAIISDYWMELPEANSVIHQMDNGDLIRQLNPHLPISYEVRNV